MSAGTKSNKTIMKQWLNKKCNTFSLLAGEDVTYKDVVVTHVGVAVLILACGFAEWLSI